MTAKLTGAACRAGRALLKWSTRDLAREADASPATINLLEADRPYRAGTADKIVDAFNRHGVEITNGRGTGARMVFVEIRPHQRDSGEWCVLVKLAAGDPIIGLPLHLAAIEASNMAGDPTVCCAIRAALDDALRYSGAPIAANMLPCLRPAWRVVQAQGAQALFTAEPTPPSNVSIGLWPDMSGVENALAGRGCIQSALRPDLWIEQ